MTDTLPPLDAYGDTLFCGQPFMDFIVSWEGAQAEFLGKLLLDTLRPKSVIDFGCGPGNYLLPFKRAGAEVLGLDADPLAGRCLPVDSFKRADLREPHIALRRYYDLALCIEVAEHIHEEFADALVDNLCECAGTIFWSAATPGQGGQFHHNEQPPEYWAVKFGLRGFKFHPRDGEIRAAIAANEECRKVEWLVNNARIYTRDR